MKSEKQILSRIIEIETELNKIQDVDLLLERLLYDSRKATKADAGSLYVVSGKDQLAFRCSQNRTLEKNLGPHEKLIYKIFKVPITEESISGWVALNKEPLNIKNMYRISKKKPYKFNKDFDKKSGYKTVSCLSHPLVSNAGKILGVLQLINAMDDEGNIIHFSKEDELFITHFANIATIALERAQMTRTLIMRMVKMAGLRDPKETGAHVNRVASYAVELYEAYANHVKMPKQDIQRMKDMLRMAAMLHDVGKVAISDNILKKKGSLDDDEYGTMKRHTLYGAEILEDTQTVMDAMANKVALRHHENWDGTGYPGKVDIKTAEPLEVDDNGKTVGYAGEEIPLSARIVSICDVFDALSCRRSYKEPWPKDKVFEEMERDSGKKFDPLLLDLFFKIYPTIKMIQERYPEEV